MKKRLSDLWKEAMLQSPMGCWHITMKRNKLTTIQRESTKTNSILNLIKNYSKYKINIDWNYWESKELKNKNLQKDPDMISMFSNKNLKVKSIIPTRIWRSTRIQKLRRSWNVTWPSKALWMKGTSNIFPSATWRAWKEKGWSWSTKLSIL